MYIFKCISDFDRKKNRTAFKQFLYIQGLKIRFSNVLHTLHCSTGSDTFETGTRRA